MAFDRFNATEKILDKSKNQDGIVKLKYTRNDIPNR